MRLAAALLLLAAQGCLAEPGLEPGAGGLVGGVADTAHPAVGILRIGPGQCTGTLIGPRVVATVKHCLPTGPTPPIRFSLGAAGEIEAGTGVAVFHRTPPEGYKRQTHDIIAIVLDRDAPAAPIPPRRAALSDDLEDELVTLVGYGVTAAGLDDSGVRRSGPATIDSIHRLEFMTSREGTSQVTSCNGDSGGAVVLDGELAGVIIGSVGGNCRKVAIHTRVDAYPDVIDAAFAEATRRALSEPPAPEPEPMPAPEPEPEPEPEPDGVDPNAHVCEPGYCQADDGFCDEALDCCDLDPDCAAAPEVCDCDVTWGCDDCWCEPAAECEEP